MKLRAQARCKYGVYVCCESDRNVASDRERGEPILFLGCTLKILQPPGIPRLPRESLPGWSLMQNMAELGISRVKFYPL
jgi:hypothetical protein